MGWKFRNYGEGEVKFKIIFNEPIPKADIINDPSIAFGEAYMTKKIDIEGSIQKVIESLYNNKESFLSNSDKYANLLKMVQIMLKIAKKILNIIMILEMIFINYG